MVVIRFTDALFSCLLIPIKSWVLAFQNSISSNGPAVSSRPDMSCEFSTSLSCLDQWITAAVSLSLDILKNYFSWKNLFCSKIKMLIYFLIAGLVLYFWMLVRALDHRLPSVYTKRWHLPFSMLYQSKRPKIYAIELKSRFLLLFKNWNFFYV